MTDPCQTPLWRQAAGTGPPVMLVHGLGASAHYWDGVMAATVGRALVAPDLLGFGRSPAPADATYDVPCHVRALAPFVRPGTVVVGHSTGAIVAVALASAYADAVKALVLVGLPAYPDANAARRDIGRVGLLARLTVEERPSARLLCGAMCRFRPVAVAAAPWIVRDMPRAVAADAARHTWVSYSRTLQGVAVGHRVDAELARLRMPIELLHGRADRTAPVRYVEDLAARLADAGAPVTLRVVEGDHHLPVRQPGLVARTIEAH